jgi:hypothetical protein
MKLLLILLTLSLSAFAFAGDRNTAYEVVCKNMTFETDRNECIRIIRPFNYFDDRALQLCEYFNFDSVKRECLGYIGDKNYASYEMTTCENATFDSEKLRCLRDNGQSNGQTCLPRSETLNQLRQAQFELRQGNTGTVDKRLTYLIGKFSNCIP